MRFGFVQSVSALAALAAAGAASAQTPWGPPTTPNGSGSFFDYFMGQNSNTNLFGTPTLVGNQFQFFPSNFVAQGLNGSAGLATDQMSVRLVAHPNQRFTQIQIQEFGTWAITGVGSVQDSGSMFIQDLLIPGRTAVNSLITNPAMPITTPGSGTWSGSVMIDLDAIVGPNWTDIMLVFTNTLQAGTTGQGSAATITKKIVSGPSVTVTVFPTPGTGMVLLAGLGLLARRRR